jgi:hypothetical protein
VKITKSIKILILLEITSLILIFPIATSARADSGTTGISFLINPYTGGLAIAVPATGSFASIISPENSINVTLTLGTVTITDTRRSVGGTWTTSAQSSNLLSLTDTLTASSFSYSSGVEAKSGGVVSLTSFDRTALDIPISVKMGTAITGNHIVSWTPTLTIPVSASKAPGLYSGVITHSVS